MRWALIALIAADLLVAAATYEPWREPDPSMLSAPAVALAAAAITLCSFILFRGTGLFARVTATILLLFALFLTGIAMLAFVPAIG